jgi:hypothetical protein
MDDVTATAAFAADRDAFAQMHRLAGQQPKWCSGKTWVARCYQAAKLTLISRAALQIAKQDPQSPEVKTALKYARNLRLAAEDVAAAERVVDLVEDRIRCEDLKRRRDNPGRKNGLSIFRFVVGDRHSYVEGGQKFRLGQSTIRDRMNVCFSVLDNCFSSFIPIQTAQNAPLKTYIGAISRAPRKPKPTAWGAFHPRLMTVAAAKTIEKCQRPFRSAGSCISYPIHPVALDWFADCILNAEWEADCIRKADALLCDAAPGASVPLTTDRQRCGGIKRLHDELEINVALLSDDVLSFWVTFAVHGTGKKRLLKIRNAVYEKRDGQVWPQYGQTHPHVWNPFRNPFVLSRGVRDSRLRAVTRLFAEAQQVPARSLRRPSLSTQDETPVRPLKQPARNTNLAIGFDAMQRQHDGGDLSASRLFQHSPTWKEE